MHDSKNLQLTGDIKRNIDDIIKFSELFKEFDNNDIFFSKLIKKFNRLKSIAAFYENSYFVNIFLKIQKIIEDVQKKDEAFLNVFIIILSKFLKDIMSLKYLNNIEDEIPEFSNFLNNSHKYVYSEIKNNVPEKIISNYLKLNKMDMIQLFIVFSEFEDRFLDINEDTVLNKKWNVLKQLFNNISFETLVELKGSIKKKCYVFSKDVDVKIEDEKVLIIKNFSVKVVEFLCKISELIFFIKGCKVSNEIIIKKIGENTGFFFNVSSLEDNVLLNLDMVLNNSDVTKEEVENKLKTMEDNIIRSRFKKILFEILDFSREFSDSFSVRIDMKNKFVFLVLEGECYVRI